MKTIDAKSMLIGFLLCACGFLFMGQSSYHDHDYDYAQIYHDHDYAEEYHSHNYADDGHDHYYDYAKKRHSH